MSFNHVQQLGVTSTRSDTSSTANSCGNSSANALLQHVARSSFHPNTVDSTDFNHRADQKENTADISQYKLQLESVQTAVTNLEQYTRNMHSSFTRLFYSLLQLYLANEPESLLSGDANHFLHTILEIIHQLQQQQLSQIHVDDIPRHKATESSKVARHFGMNMQSISVNTIVSIPNQPQIANNHRNNTNEINNNIQNMMTQYPPHRNLHVTHKDEYKYDINSGHEPNENREHALAEPVHNEQDVLQRNIELNISEFLLEYNRNRPENSQISGDAVICCFRDNKIDYTDFKDLNRSLKRYGIPAGAVRKLWRFLNPVEINEDDQDDENVVRIPTGSYIYIPSEYEYFLSLPDDWSDHDE